jgi:hypothetical protein
MRDAARYAAIVRGRLAEKPLLRVPRKIPELEIQARWFAGEFGRRFKSTAGDEVEIKQFGIWNREPGPDFSDAGISINSASTVRGGIELESDARDWERHGHATDPVFESVVLHVFWNAPSAKFFTQTNAHRNVTQILLDLGALENDPPNSLPVAKAGRCSAPLRGMDEERIRELLRSASQFRMQKKSARLARLIEVHGWDSALYQSLAATLGYKNNQLPFTLLSQRLPLQSAGTKEALFFGVSGFLDSPDLKQFEADTRSYLREMWEHWWALRDQFHAIQFDRGLWRLAGSRPANHPQRRVAALAQMVARWKELRTLAVECNPAAITDFFATLRHPYWDYHFTLTSARTARRMALVGNTRVAEMLANVFFPLAMAANDRRWPEYAALRAVLTNRRVEIAALRLFADHPLRDSILKTVANQQGLLQIYEDFCMQDDSDCANCPFPRQLEQWR